MSKKLNLHGFVMHGLRRASAATHCLPGNCGYSAAVFFDRESCEVSVSYVPDNSFFSDDPPVFRVSHHVSAQFLADIVALSLYRDYWRYIPYYYKQYLYRVKLFDFDLFEEMDKHGWTNQ